MRHRLNKLADMIMELDLSDLDKDDAINAIYDVRDEIIVIERKTKIKFNKNQRYCTE